MSFDNVLHFLGESTTVSAKVPDAVFELVYDYISDGAEVLKNLDSAGVKTLQQFKKTEPAELVEFCLSFYKQFNFIVADTEEDMTISTVEDYWAWLQKIK